MLKTALRYLGIGFFLAGTLLLGLKTFGMLDDTSTQTVQNETTSIVTTTVSTVGNTTTTQSESSTQTSQTTQTQSTNSGSDTQITVEPGEFSYAVAEKLMNAGIISSVDDFVGYLVSNGLDGIIYPGTYTVSSSMSFEELGRTLTTYPGN